MATEQNRNEYLGSEAKIAVLQRDVINMSDLFAKVESALNKLTETAVSINKILAVQDTRISTTERNSNILEQLIEKRTSDLTSSDREINNRISVVQQEIMREFEEIENRIIGSMKELKNDIRAEFSTFKEDNTKLEKRVEVLERWRWIVVGISATLGFIFAKVDVAVLLNNLLR